MAGDEPVRVRVQWVDPGEDTAWKARAACSGLTSLFYNERTDPGRPWDEARRVCNTVCPVRSECLEYALRHKEQHGVWGGMTERERKRLGNQRRRENERNDVTIETTRGAA